ncbi:MAG: tryptophan synthase subunit beta like protein [Halioglobus sp.]|nr:tryptophan synthase subunit beta like protein [Halioglobus sp.]|tara:strand:+ start:813 stop:1130 length:318 start_codon:yes stop_codon:yes gene_type:complete
MAYVKRDSGGAIVAASAAPEGDYREWVDADDPALQAFVSELTGDQAGLEATDQDFVRVLEDVVDLLINKGVILFTELPDSAQHKILTRQRLRTELGAALDLLGED